MTEDLSFATTSELVDELFRRHDGIAIVRIPKGQQGAQALIDHHGTFYTVLGLVAQMHHDLLTRDMTPAGEDSP